MLTGCAGISKEDYARLIEQNDSLANQNTALANSQAQLKSQITEARSLIWSEQQLLMAETVRVECLARLVETEHTCDALTRDVEDIAERNQLVLACMASRKFRNGIRDCP